nr:hypothetical protein [Pseudomonas sp. dw_358]
MNRFEVHYAFNAAPRHHVFELPVPDLSAEQALMHLLQLHFGDGENSLIMPTADAGPDEIAQQAAELGIVLVAVDSL